MMKIEFEVIKFVRTNLSLIVSVVISAEFDKEDYCSIFYNCDRKEIEIT